MPRALLALVVVGTHLATIREIEALALAYVLPVELLTLLALLLLLAGAPSQKPLSRWRDGAGLILGMLSIAAMLVLMPRSPGARRQVRELSPGTSAATFMLARLFDFDGDGVPSLIIPADCNDDDPYQHPLALELVGNGIDDNCLGGDLKTVTHTPPRILPQPPALDVVLITIDTLRAEVLRAHADERSRNMPRLDAFASKGVIFTRAYAQAPFTGDSITALMSGEYPMSFRMGDQQLGHEPYIAELLRARGYRTVVQQQVWEDDKPNAHWGFYDGFDMVDDSLAASNAGQRAVTSERTTDKALEHLAALDAQEQPYFFWVHYFDPHGEYMPHEGTPFPGEDQHARYQQEVFTTDRALGRLLDELERSGALEHTLVVVSGDHGEHLGERGREGHAWWLSEKTLHTVLAVRGPGVPARPVETRVRLIDVYPTVLELAAGIRVASAGRDLRPVWSGVETRDRDVVARSQYRNVLLRTIISERYKLIEDVPGDALELYDLATDPDESIDLSDQRPDLVAKLRHRLGRVWDTSMNDAVLRRRR